MEPRPDDRLVLVIGGAGYIGSVLIRRLLQQGYRVRVLDALLYGNESAVAKVMDDPLFGFIRGDFRDLPTLGRALDNVTEVVLLAALVGDPICRKYPDLARSINDIGTINLIDQLNGRGISRFVFMSTCSNYGLRDTDAEATESSELNPQSLYAETKVGVEEYILGSQAAFDFHATILRAATVYGISPRMRFDLTVNEFVRELAVGNELLVYDADTWRPYCHVDDIATAIINVLEAPVEAVTGEVFNLGSSGENYTKQMIVDLLIDRLPQGRVGYKAGSRDPRNYRVCFDKIADRLGFTPNNSLSGFVGELVGVIESGAFDDFPVCRDSYGNYSVTGSVD